MTDDYTTQVQFGKNSVEVTICDTADYEGCKKDIKGDGQVAETLGLTADQRLPTTEDAEALARQMGADLYLECSAFTGEGIDNVILQATRITLSLPRKKILGCIPL
ncbi:GTP-binding protein Rho1 [Serendipita sp. 399]|nr:GTP-binding protein Rho1 [Serendipita sp. 399]